MIKAAGGLIIDKGRVVLVHRPRYDDWSLPKGKLEPGETFEAAALREIEEECNLRCQLHEELQSDEYNVRKGKKLVRWWRMSVVEDLGFQPDDEVDELRWLSTRDAKALASYDHDRLLLARHGPGRFFDR